MRKTLLTLAATLCAAVTVSAQNITVGKISAESNRTIKGASCDCMDNYVAISVEIDAPTAAVASKSPKLYNAIMGFLTKETGLSAAALKSKAALDGAVKSRCNAKAEPFEERISIEKVYEDDKYVSFSVYHYRMKCENVHGLASDYGVTFRKSDAHRLTWADFSKTEALRKAVTRNLVRSDEGEEVRIGDVTSYMEDCDECRLSDGSYAFKLPETVPHLTSRGWCFSYQPYETPLMGMYAIWSYVKNVDIISWDF